MIVTQCLKSIFYVDKLFYLLIYLLIFLLYQSDCRDLAAYETCMADSAP